METGILTEEYTGKFPEEPEKGSPADPVQAYIQEIDRAPVLSEEEEKELAERIGQGDAEAKKQLTEANLRLVVSIAKRYADRGIDFFDLIQAGNLGLFDAVERFDCSWDCGFRTYAARCVTGRIRQAITRAVADQERTVRTPVQQAETLHKLNRILHRLRQEYGREPKPEELAGEMNLPVDRVRGLLELMQEKD